MDKKFVKNLLISLIFLALIGFAHQTEAGNCGGGTVCQCGDTVIASTTLSADLSCTATALIVGADSVTIDGNNHTITGDGGSSDYGISSSGRNNVVIKNFASINTFDSGIYFSNTDYSIIENVTVSASTYGLYLVSSDYGTTTNSTTTGNSYGIYLQTSRLNHIIGNVANSNSQYGIYLYNLSDSNVLTGNIANLNTKHGMYIHASNSNTLTGNTVNSNTKDGIQLYSSAKSNILTDNTVASNNESGIYINGSNSNTLDGNTVTLNKQYGIRLGSANSGILRDNIITSNVSYGLYISNSELNNLTGNALSGNPKGFYITSKYNNTIATSNTVGGKPLYYLYNIQGTEAEPAVYDGDILGEIGAFVVASSTYMQVKNAILSPDNYAGVYFYNTSSSTVENIIATSSYYGISLEYSSLNTVTGNIISSSSAAGIYLNNSGSNTVSSNNVSSTTQSGIQLLNSNSNTFTENTATLNLFAGINIGNGSASNTFAGNTVNLNNNYGISIGSNSNTFTGNTVNSNNGIGFYIVSNYNIFANNIADSNTSYGFLVSGSVGQNEFTDNSANSNSTGFYISSDSNTFTENTASNNTYGFDLIGGAELNALMGNNASSNSRGFYLNGGDYNNLTNNTVIDNTDVGIYLTGAISNTFTGNTVNSNNSGIRVGENSDSNTFSDNTINSNDYAGVFITQSASSTLTSNTIEANGSYGIYLYVADYSSLIGNSVGFGGQNAIYVNNSDNCTIRDNIIYSGYSYDNNSSSVPQHGIYLSSSTFSNIIGNVFNRNPYGIRLELSDSNVLTANVFSLSNSSILDEGIGNTYFSNQFLHISDASSTTMIIFTDEERERTVNEEIDFSFSMRQVDKTPCSDCTYAITVSPTETVSATATGSEVTGSFTPTKLGLYSLVVEVTDSNNNKGKKNIQFLVKDENNPVATSTVRYYFRDDKPVHGQVTAPTDFYDSGSLLLAPPTTEEDRHCGIWVQFSPDELPTGLATNAFVVLKKVDFYVWYKTDKTGYLSVQRQGIYNSLADISVEIPTSTDYAWIYQDIADINWGMDYMWNWYMLALKFNGFSPYIKTMPESPSYAELTYAYSPVPSVTTNSNPDVFIRSVNSLSNATSTISIILENSGNNATSTDLTLTSFKKPFSGVTSTIYATATTTFNTGSMTPSTVYTFNSVNMEIAPSSGSVDISIDTWNTLGSYYKKWIESADGLLTVEHVIGGLDANTEHTLKIDGTTYNTYIPNASGEISFTYSGSFSEHIFEMTGSVLLSASSPPSSVVSGGMPSAWYNPPQTPSGGFQVSIGGGASYTTSREVILKLKGGSDTVRMAISNSPEFKDIGQETYNETKKWDLCQGKASCPDGKYTVYVKFYAPWGTNSGIVSCTVDLKSGGASVTSIPTSYSFNTNLQYRYFGDNIKYLQIFLNSDPDTKIAQSGPGSTGEETNYFGSLTRSAVTRFQEKYTEDILTPWGLTKGTGYVGKTTRAKINELLGR